MRIAAIDQGTTSTRVLVAGPGQAPRIVHAVRHAQLYAQPGWVEHDPVELLRNVTACLEAAGPVDAIGIDNQGESCLAWDAATGEAISPVIVWQDNRTGPAIERLRAEGAEQLTLERAGLPLDPYFSAAKFAWILDNIPEARRRADKGRLRLGTTDSFFLDRLAGRFVTDATTASRTSLANLATGTWDGELCRLFGIPMEALAPIGPTAGVELGRIGGVPVTASVVDQQAALYGHGCRRRGETKITFGTGAFALAVTGEEIVRAPQIGLLPTVAWRIGEKTSYAVDGGVYDAGASIEWLMRLGLLQRPEDLDAFAAPPAIDRGLAFVPALSGLACPWWDRSAAGLWLGMSADTSREDLCQAVLEGVALHTQAAVAAIDSRLGLAGPISIDGGLSRSRTFSQFLADVLDKPLIGRGFDEMTAFGCAALAGLALDIDLALPSAGDRVLAPDAADSAARLRRFQDAVGRSRGWRSP